MAPAMLGAADDASDRAAASAALRTAAELALLGRTGPVLEAPDPGVIEQVPGADAFTVAATGVQVRNAGPVRRHPAWCAGAEVWRSHPVLGVSSRQCRPGAGSRGGLRAAGGVAGAAGVAARARAARRDIAAWSGYGPRPRPHNAWPGDADAVSVGETTITPKMIG